MTGELRVLLVDDEEEYVRTLAERMEMRGIGPRVALSGDEALRMLEEEAPHVIVLDLRMPGTTGMEVLERIRRGHPGVEVIILTGHGSEKEEREARRLGAFQYLQKPIDTGTLVDTIRAAWRKSLEATIDVASDARGEFDRTMRAAVLAEANLPEMARETMRETAAEEADGAPPSTRSLRVLLVDDEEEYVRTMAERLGIRDVGSKVALDGRQALGMLEDDVPDVMVLDLKMPGMGGIGVLKRVKNKYPQLEVIILTGTGTDRQEEEARRAGAFDYLRKPVDLDELVEVIRRAGRARGEGA